MSTRKAGRHKKSFQVGQPHPRTMARKKEDRVVQDTHKKEKQIMESYLADDVNFVSFKDQLSTLGLQLRDIPGDGNCLFRALGDQQEGHSRNHYKHRLETVQYMRDHRHEFEPFVEDDIPFDRHLALLRKPGTYAGNECLAAFARNHQLNIVIHQLNSPVWQIKGTEAANTPQLHISYHNGDHYSSVRKIGDNAETPSNITLKIGNENEIQSSKAKKEGKKSQEKSKDYVNDYSNWSEDYVVEGMARAVRGLSDVEEHVMNATGCMDHTLICQTLEDNCYDVDATVAVLLSVMSTVDHNEMVSVDATSISSHQTSDSGIWSDSGTGTRIFGNCTEPSSSGARPKQTNSTVKQKRDKKLEKKKRAEERHRQKVLDSLPNGYSKGASNRPDSSESDNDGHVVLANGVGMLSL